MANVEDVLTKLKAQAKPDQLAGMAKFGLTGDKRLGVAIPDLRKLARAIGKDHALALALWETQIPEALMLASMIDQPVLVTDAQMESWVQDFKAWDVCDQVCMNLFEKTPLVWQKIGDWSQREEEFVKRAAYALLACLAWHDKKATDEAFIQVLPVIKAGATDGRNFVKKGGVGRSATSAIAMPTCMLLSSLRRTICNNSMPKAQNGSVLIHCAI